ncbi:uncharacterized protein DUF3313 [Alteromonadaceae bacterium 2753L.S.0a.02]|nr:uncharacterized protein DUF3313 [Alteromonadaceae bacterium 2753L.S.0a.02]
MTFVNIKIRTLFWLLIATLSWSGEAFAGSNNQAKVASNFTVWKGGNFHRFVVDKSLDYSQYNKIIVFPLDLSEFKLADKTKRQLRKNWEDFQQEESQLLIDRMAEVSYDEFKNSRLQPTEKGGKGVLVVQVRALEFLPRAYRDRALGTVGTELIESIGQLSYQITLLDSATHQTIGLIEDDINIAPPRKVTNTRDNHQRSWKRSFEFIFEHFHRDFEKLQKESPLKK